MSKSCHKLAAVSRALFAALLAFAIALPGSSALAQQRQLLDRVVAIVDSDVVLLSELQSRLRDVRQTFTLNNQPMPPEGELRQQVLDQLVLESIQMQLAERASIRYDDDTINRVLANMAENNGMTFDQYLNSLQTQGVYLQTREQVRKQLTLQELQRGMVNRRITVTNQEIENFLNSEMGREVMSADYLVEHLLVQINSADNAASREAKLRHAAELAARVREGEPLPAVRQAEQRARQFPIAGTNFGWRKAGGLPTLFSDVVTDMSIGDVEGPIEAGNGYHIIQLADKRGGTEQIVDQTHLRHIMLTPNEIRTEEQTIEEIEELRQRILDGEDFASIARQNSDDASSVVAGGDLDWINQGGMPPEMQQMADSLAIGELSEPFRTETGWHLMEVLDRREQDLSRQYTRNQAANALRNRKFDLELQNWLIEIRDEAFVEIVE